MKLVLSLLSFLLFSDILFAQDLRLVLPEGHLDMVTCLDYSPDGKYIVTGSRDKTAKIWECRTGKLVYTLSGHKEVLTSVKFSRDSKKIVTTAFDSNPIVWDALTGLEIIRLQEQMLVDCYCYAEFNEDGTKILVPLKNKNAIIFDAAKGIALTELDEIKDWNAYIFNRKFCGNFHARYTHDNRHIITSFVNERAYIWSTDSNKIIHELVGHHGVITSVQVSDNDEYILTNSADSSARLWDTQTGELLGTFYIEGYDILSTVLSTDSKLLVLLSSDSSLIFYDIAKKETRRVLKYKGGYIKKIVFNADGSLMATIDVNNLLGVWNTARCNVITQKQYDDKTNAVQFSPDGKELAVASGESIFLLSTPSLSEIHVLNTAIFPTKLLANTPDGKIFITTSNCSDFALRVWDLPRGRLYADIPAHNDLIIKAAYSRSGHLLASASYDSTIKIWDTKKWSCVDTIDRYGVATDLQFSASDRFLAAFFADGFIRVFEVASKKEKFSVDAGEGIVKVAFFQDDSLLIYGSSEGHFSGINIFTGEKQFEFTIAASNQFQFSVVTIDFDIEKKYILLALGGKGKIIDSKTFIVLYEFDIDNISSVVAVKMGSVASEIFYLLASDRLCKLDLEKKEDEILSKEPEKPKTNLSTIELKHVENGIAITSDKRFIISLNDSLSIFDCQLQKTIVKVAADNFLLSDSGRLIIYNKSGRLFAYSLEYLEEIAQIVSMNGVDNGFVTLIKNGYYRGNHNCISKLNYARQNKLFELTQFDVKYNRPDKILSHLNKFFNAYNSPGQINLYQKAYYKRLARMNIDSTMVLTDIVYPVCEISNENQIKQQQDTFNITLTIKAAGRGALLQSFNLLVNDVPLYGKNGIQIGKRNTQSFDTVVNVPLLEGMNIIEPYVINNQGFSSASLPLCINVEGSDFYYFDTYSDSLGLEPMKMHFALNEHFYFFGIGIDKFKDKQQNLQWSVKDIRDLAAQLKSRYPEIIIDTLFDKNVTRENIKALKQKLYALTAADKVIVSYSGHGVLNENLDYYLSTYPMDFDNPEKKGVLYEEFENLLDSILPRRKLMIIDACNSGEIDKNEFGINSTQPDSTLEKQVKGIIMEGNFLEEGQVNNFELMQELFADFSKGNGATIFAASSGTQNALESNVLKNGVFTHCILQTFKNYKQVNLLRFKQIVSRMVVELTNGFQRPTTRYETPKSDWIVW